MSLTRGLASLRLATASSSVLPAVASTSRHLASIAPTDNEAKSSYVMNPVPRPSSFRSRFPDAPLHSHVSHPDRLFEGATGEHPAIVGGNSAAEKEVVLAAVTGLPKDEIRLLNRYAVVVKRVVNMTKKGKMYVYSLHGLRSTNVRPSFASMLVVGSPTRGLVGIGRGRGLTATSAIDNGFHKGELA
jgi:small subunit ribosomal protein S5